MRLHHLRATAFGPFADQVDLDLDTLGAQGLFLIHGATGAGKTSLLDALCFALYAGVPGARPAGRSLRSDHAARDAVPEVELEFTASGRRLRLHRTAEYTRPKRRGTGERSVPASARLEELTPAGWKALSTRQDEIGEVVRDVLGMGLEQFAKVVLLPQGDVAAFLRATPEDRRQLLERLFDVTLFTDVELWLACRRRELTARVADLRSALAADLQRLRDAVIEVPDLAQDREDATDLDTTAGLQSLAERVGTWATLTMADDERAVLAAAVSTAELSAAQTRMSLRAKGERAQVVLSALADAGELHARARTQLDRARRAAGARGHLDAQVHAERETERVSRDRDQAHHAVRRLVGSDTGSALPLAELVTELRGQDDRLAELDLHVERLAATAQRSEDLRRRLTAADDILAALVDRVEETRVDLAVVEVSRADAASAKDSLGGLEQSAQSARRLRDLRRHQDLAEQRLTELRNVEPSARSSAQDARDRLLDRREARISGMAAELADALTDAAPCPVCGATEHPAPATAHRRVTAAEVGAAEQAYDVAQQAWTALRQEIASVGAAVDARAGDLADQGTAEDLTVIASAARDALARATSSAAEAPALLTLAGRAREALAQAERAVAASRDRAASDRATLQEVEASRGETHHLVLTTLAVHRGACPCSEAQTQLDDASTAWSPGISTPSTATPIGVDTAGSTRDDLVTTAAAERRRHDALTRAVSAAARADDAVLLAERRLHDTRTAAAAAARSTGLGAVDDVIAALLPDEAVLTLARQLETVAAQRVSAQTTLEDPDIADALQIGWTDLATLDAAARDADRTRQRAHQQRTLATRAQREVDRLRPVVEEHLVALAPAVEEQETITELADLVAGTGGGNEMRMRLSAYVLAARLEKVAALANERLAVMGQGRYQLLHSDERAARGAKSGLGLRVRDLWTGQTRETTTLSGGEGFMAALALALGLADAVREESGGLDLQTLIIDEGFGSLDEDSLEQVMEVLDGLREGGRAVGVVSHVPELRARIPSQVRVLKSEVGSSVEVVGPTRKAGSAA